MQVSMLAYRPSDAESPGTPPASERSITSLRLPQVLLRRAVVGIQLPVTEGAQLGEEDVERRLVLRVVLEYGALEVLENGPGARFLLRLPAMM